MLITIIITCCVSTACSYRVKSDKEVEKLAIEIIQKADEKAIYTLYTWSIGQRGDFYIFSKNAKDSNCLYCVYFNKNKRIIRVSLQDFECFNIDFKCRIENHLNQYRYLVFEKTEANNVRITGKINTSDIVLIKEVQINDLFPETNPFDTFSTLSELIVDWEIISSTSRQKIGNFIELSLLPQHKLTYLPDSLYIDPRYKEQWMKKFATGKMLNKNWNLRKLDKPHEYY